MEQPHFPKFTCRKLTDIEKDRDTDAKISSLVADLQGTKSNLLKSYQRQSETRQ